jgi:general secretion pathway protein H
MRMSALGNDVAPTLHRFAGRCPPRGLISLGAARREIAMPLLRGSSARNSCGFTLLELLLVVAIIAVASAGVSFALRDSAQTQLEREAVRLAALLESARTRSMASGVPVRWRTTATGFVFDGLALGSLPEGWLSPDVNSTAPAQLLLGPEPIIAPQSVRLTSRSQPDRALNVSTDGVRPFSVRAGSL